MGDRGNIAIVHGKKEQVWLYSHWGGSDLPNRLKKGLDAGRGRWNDDSYLTKIIIGHVVPPDNWKEETGYGISTRLQDNEHEILVVDIPNQRVFTIEEEELENFKVPDGYVPDESKQWSFEKYSSLSKTPAT